MWRAAATTCFGSRGKRDARARALPPLALLTASVRSLKAWDVSAGHLILAEAGGRYTDMHGKPVSYERAVADERFNIVGSNGHIHDATLAVFQRVRDATGLTE